MRLIVTSLLVLGVAGAAWADRCIGPKDNDAVQGALTFGISPIDAADIVWCDDFNSYCLSNELAESTWPGYPPTPDNICGSEDIPLTTYFQDAVHWPRMVETGDRTEIQVDSTVPGGGFVGWDITTNWAAEPYVTNLRGGTRTTVYNSFDMTGAIENKFGEGNELLFGTDENPLVLRYWMYHPYNQSFQPATSPHYVEIRMDRGTDHPNDWATTDYVEADCETWNFCTCIADNPEAYCDPGECGPGACVDWRCDPFAGNTCNGGPNDGLDCQTDADCLQTCDAPGFPVCTTNADCAECISGPNLGEGCITNTDCGACVGGGQPGSTCTEDLICKRRCGEGQIALCEAGGKEGEECTTGSDCASGPFFPIVTQQRYNSMIAVPRPPLDTEQTWRSLAFGMLAQTDFNPCSATYRAPVSYRPATFDGNRWHQLRPNVFPGEVHGGTFMYDRGQAFFEMEVRSSNYILRFLSAGSGGAPYTEPVWSDAVVPRRYFGPFNTISMGTGPSRKWVQDTETLTWSLEGEPDLWRYVKDYPATHWFQAWIDRPAVLGGEGGVGDGACCLPDLTCIETDWEDCESQDGTFQGSGTLCAETLCCHYPWADADGDGDVDQVDFGAWQACYTGPGGGILPGCECFDRNNSGSVDGDDFIEFMNCYTGSNVAFDPLWQTQCNP